MQQFRNVRRNGFTTIELLTVLVVTSLLFALLLPAVLRTRERARAVTCMHQLHQMSAACHSFESVHQRFPPYMIFDPRRRVAVANISGHVYLLPFLDQQAIYDEIDFNESGRFAAAEPPGSETNAQFLSADVPVFHCPSDNLPAGGVNYRACTGTSPGSHQLHRPFPDVPAPPLWGVFRIGFGKRASDVRDGLSHTAFFSERVGGDRNREQLTAWRDVIVVTGTEFRMPDDVLRHCGGPLPTSVQHVSFGGSTWLFADRLHTQYNHVLPPNSRIPDCIDGISNWHSHEGASTARSLHIGGVNVAFGDGSTRFISDSIDLSVWRALGSRAGGEVVGSIN